jgi:hypothetical protein
MRAWLIKEGVEVIAVKFNGLAQPTFTKKEMKKEVMYFEEDVAIDPIGKFGCGPQYNTIGGDWARKGFYGFKLPENKSGYEIILVHTNDIIVG